MTTQPITTSATYTAGRPWLASTHGTDQTETVTVDASKLVANTHYVASTDSTQPYSRLLSGLALGKITASGLYGPYDPAATDGRQTLCGLVYDEALFAPGQTRIPCALLWHGVARASKIPGGIDTTKITASPGGAQIRFV
ncbi:head decoration protein [Kitasatospora brasiliensis]|uniref:head decoration protein n=1 Tax=Kitasatospora brasiliensis TaxID=3058040 RepID=UPI00292D327D|nr:head decoration protein [Kitasatospora sp. K002]